MIILAVDCMATLRICAPTIFQDSTKSKYLVKFLVLSIIFLNHFCLISSDDNPPVSEVSAAVAVSSNIRADIKRQLHSSASPASVNSLNREKIISDRSTVAASSAKHGRKVEFEGEAHEVPSGPNPISNR